METTPLPLLRLFMERRQELRRRLKHRLGSDELANDALQETYLRIERMGDSSCISSNPAGYLFRMAINAASDQRHAEARYLTGSEVEDLLNVGTDTLDPARVVHAEQEVQALGQALAELSGRQRAILIAARVEDVAQEEIARRFGISVRMVGKELKKALEHCGRRLDRKVVQRFGPGAGKES
ncbi:RNA polymerase sigma factor [Dyella choica]|uniref:RNA polymerase sigma factor n=1 Tax=Dyella choica TaxID=1927959 RepID=A0A3S0RKA5_9GAMM|nr:RNA polymerase sigma factor [Dyella choica]RUL75245.1 RNA polymerase sigma factor [Dyella choica]